MPPRKRTETKPPAPDAAELPAEATVIADSAAEPATEDPAPNSEELDAAAGSPDEATEDEPQASDEPCPICVPGGWADGVTAVGCEHGHWTREATD